MPASYHLGPGPVSREGDGVRPSGDRECEGGYHVPVMVDEVLRLLPDAGTGVMLDCTVGDGGHALHILSNSGWFVVGIDKDEEAIKAATERLSPYRGRVILVRADFRDMRVVLAAVGIGRVHGVLFDLGVSLRQLQDPSRGFTYRGEAPLDMRMDRSESVTAAELLATCSEEELERILSRYGEERFARHIARLIVEERRRRPLKVSSDLVQIVYRAIPAGARRTGPHPARRTFQALRIAVNRELEGLDRALETAFYLTKSGGRVMVLSYHSLEDSISKAVFRRMEAARLASVLTRKPLRPSKEERERNPRSRSAKLRAASVV